jgi:steroid delta-isomerase-like uncharacterized protein
MNRAEIAKILETWLDAITRHDVPALVSLYTEDCVVESRLAARAVQGREANADVFRAFFEAFPDVRIVAGDLIIEGDQAVQIGVINGTATGGLMGIAPTGKPTAVPIVHVFQLRDGLIARERRIYDFTGLLVQAGVLKAKPA